MSNGTAIYKGHLNKTTLIGGLKAVPELKPTPYGQVVTVALATKFPVRNKETGHYEEQTEWHNMVLFDALAEKVIKMGRPGMRFYVEGPKQTRRFELDGKAVKITEVVATIFEPMDPIHGAESKED